MNLFIPSEMGMTIVSDSFQSFEKLYLTKDRDLDPKASFELKGEQIDGAFSLEGTDYIFEAEWQKGAISRRATR